MTYLVEVLLDKLGERTGLFLTIVLFVVLIKFKITTSHIFYNKSVFILSKRNV